MTEHSPSRTNPVRAGDAGPSTSSETSKPSSSSSNTPVKPSYANYATWGQMRPPAYAGYSPASTNATMGQPSHSNIVSNPYAAHIYQPPTYNAPYSVPTVANPTTSSKTPATTAPRSESLPKPEMYKHWDEVLKKFLLKMKMTQTLKGFENDMLVLNSEWEQQVVIGALKEMVTGMQSILQRTNGKQKARDDDTQIDIISNEKQELDERKLSYVHLSNGVQPKTQSSINRSISQFLSRTRARNDASNRTEFLHTLAEEKRKLAETSEEDVGTITSCARVDAKPIDRDKQMKYDIAKNGEGPLTKTVKHDTARPYAVKSPAAYQNTGSSSSTTADDKLNERELTTKRKLPVDETDGGNRKRRKGKEKETPEMNEVGNVEEISMERATAERHPGLDARLSNLETHFALRYVPCPPRTLIARLKYLEDHLIKLEKEYPPWAALHFNQPNRGWPPPPRATPVIVPPQLRSFTSSTVPSGSIPSHQSPDTNNSVTAPIPSHNGSQSGQVAGPPAAKPRKGTSSLHKAVLDRLEVQKAMSEMSSNNKISRDS
ncbi:hypothetical protein D9613_000194 [Agrocybe pediades]|uniref:Uncharacterized protein n=1 Tax=Agrocybe pediades TaxID=84607 RepID=A0A8H4VT16_9AGAR|nr:hypothetical protein D9613_000194 [Agrocybe pediades]